MGRVGIHAWVPKQGDRDLRYDERQGKSVHPGAQDACVSFGHRGDKIGVAGEEECARKSADDGDNRPLKAQLLENLIDQAFLAPMPWLP